MKIVTVLLLVSVCSMPLTVRADDEADLQIVGQAIGEMVTAEAMLSAALDGECKQHAPEKLRISRETMRLNIADLREMVSPVNKQKITDQLNKPEFKSQLDAYRKNAVDGQLAMFHSEGVNPVFACGYVFGLLTEPVLHSERSRLRALRQLGK